MTEPPRWWELRRAHNLKPATYTCPLCGRRLASMTDHVLLFPEGDHSQRRHAHTDCVRSAREAGRLPSRSEWRRTQPARGWWPFSKAEVRRKGESRHDRSHPTA